MSEQEIEELVEGTERYLETFPPGEREKEFLALIHRAKVAARRGAFKLLKGGRQDQPKLKSEFKL